MSDQTKPETDFRKLCIALLEGLEHVEGCAQCNADDWERCDLGGSEAKKAMRDAQKVLG